MKPFTKKEDVRQLQNAQHVPEKNAQAKRGQPEKQIPYAERWPRRRKYITIQMPNVFNAGLCILKVPEGFCREADK